ncbi:MAG TPA: TadE family protein [Terracidiphilus sp.]|nr:TadE family protein [Terracidiphilus sp.]
MTITLQKICRPLAALGRSLKRENGNATIELALAFSFLLTPLMLATTEMAFIVYDSIELSNAAHAGAMYAMISSTFASDSSGIQNAVLNEAGDISNDMTVASNTYYACSASEDGTQYTTEAAANAACPANAGNHYLQFVRVTATASITPFVQFKGLPSMWSLQQQSVMEVQE